MAVTLLRAYGGYPSGSVVELPLSTETALIAQNLATTAAITAVTVGNQTCNQYSGVAAIGAGSSSVVITNSLITANSYVLAVVAQAAADGTLLRVERVVCAVGSVTIYGTANATATTLIDWCLIVPPGMSQTN